MKDLLLATADTWLPLLASVVTALLGKLLLAVNKKVNSDYANSVIHRLNASVAEVVVELEHTVVKAVKEAKADGKITPEEAAAIKKQAVDQLRAYMGAKGVKELLGVVGVPESMLESFLASKVEAAVGIEKKLSR